jgi:hypothetical protein
MEISTYLEGKGCYISNSKDARYTSSKQGINLQKIIQLPLLTQKKQQLVIRMRWATLELVIKKVNNSCTHAAAHIQRENRNRIIAT